MFFHVFVEVVGLDGIKDVEEHDDGVVGEGNVLGEEAVEESFAAAEFFHDEEVV